MIQKIIAFAILGFAVAFLIKKYFFKSKKKKDCGDGNCGCSWFLFHKVTQRKSTKIRKVI